MECSVAECKKDQLSRGLCPQHYQRLRKYGDVNIVHRRQSKKKGQDRPIYSNCLYVKCSVRVPLGSDYCRDHTPKRCDQCSLTFHPWPGCYKSRTCSNQCLMDAKYDKIAARLTAGSTLKTSAVKRYLFRYKLAEKKCQTCGLSEWMGKEIPLTLDHINGINNDNRLENVRILCPNCHSQTDTFCGKNKGNGPSSRGLTRE